MTKTQSSPFHFTRNIQVFLPTTQQPTSHFTDTLTDFNSVHTSEQPCLCLAPPRPCRRPCSDSPLAVLLVSNATNVCVPPSAHPSLLSASPRDETCRLLLPIALTHWIPCPRRAMLVYQRPRSPAFLRFPLPRHAQQSHLLQPINPSVCPSKKLKSPRPQIRHRPQPHLPAPSPKERASCVLARPLSHCRLLLYHICANYSSNQRPSWSVSACVTEAARDWHTTSSMSTRLELSMRRSSKMVSRF